MEELEKVPGSCSCSALVEPEKALSIRNYCYCMIVELEMVLSTRNCDCCMIEGLEMVLGIRNQESEVRVPVVYHHECS